MNLPNNDLKNSQKALFLDRDGVINVDYGYVYQIQNFTFVDGIFDLCKIAQELNYKIFIITNQSGIGRNYYTEEEFNNLTSWLVQKFNDNNIKIEKVYYCPHHVDAVLNKYKIKCDCRKPEPGMIIEACKEFDIDPTKSIFIGDKETDIEAATKANVGTKILFTNDDILAIQSKADFVSNNFDRIQKIISKL
ncbi:MAG: D-glycero-beta-D-manno-heptose 1,7-bisphosphate 7-phosphatase [Sphingobacteriia bacterium]|nr:D-glycero-beta-D-manno-heptose 1,7-bisphosphate 7-phosphatase [Sphingobacteriia bacterium]